MINCSVGPGSCSPSKAPCLGEQLTLLWSTVSPPPPSIVSPALNSRRLTCGEEAPGTEGAAEGRKEQRRICWGGGTGGGGVGGDDGGEVMMEQA